MEVKALSVKQPWAWCIFNGKNVENRTWRTKYRGKLFIHASKSFDKEAYYYLQQNKEHLGIENLPTSEELKKECGGFIGVVDMIACRRHLEFNKWKADNQFGWVFKNAQKLNFTPFKGRLSIFSVDLTFALKKSLGLK